MRLQLIKPLSHAFPHFSFSQLMIGGSFEQRLDLEAIGCGLVNPGPTFDLISHRQSDYAHTGWRTVLASF
jgi:hypothetical protein